MKKIKVMLASRPKMLSDVIRNMIQRQTDMVLVGNIIDPIQLLFASKEIAVDVIIVTPLQANGEPLICQHLLAEYPMLKIVTQSARGEAAFLYQNDVQKKRLDDPSAQSILHAIREAFMLDVN